MREKESWQAPASAVGREKIRVTARYFETLYQQLYLGDEDLRGKTTVSVGNGLSNVVEHVNGLSKATHCYGVDPIYAFLGENYREFLKNLEDHNLEPHMNFVDEETYSRFKSGLQDGIYVAGIGEKLPFLTGSADVEIVSELVDNIRDQRTALNIIDEALRILKADGEIRIPELSLPILKSKLSLEIGPAYVPLNKKGPDEWLALLKHIQEKGCRIFSVRSPKGRKLRESHSGVGSGMVPAFSGLIIRKDSQKPKVTYYEQTAENIPDEIDLVIELDPLNTADPKAIFYKPAEADIAYVPSNK